jgi:Pvc16 N-terminal domain
MSNFLSIATVTATLSQVIQSAIDSDVPGARVTTVRPDVAGNGPTEAKVNVFLFEATTNAAFRNVDLPTRRSDGSLIQRPKVALDLHYLINFYGDELELVPQRLLGSVARALHSQPMLTRQQINATISSGTFSFLASSDLADDVELVKFTPLPLSIEELSKLWSFLLQTPYALSMVYIGTMVLIEGEETPRQVLPVKQPLVTVLPFQQPLLQKLSSLAPGQQQPNDTQPIVLSSTLIVQGRYLQSSSAVSTLVKISGQPAQYTPFNNDPNTLSVTLPPTLFAGVQGVQVIQQLLLGDPDPAKGKPHDGFESNVLPFVLHPTIVQQPTKSNVQIDGNGNYAADVQLQVSPQIDVRQRVTLLLNELPGTSNPSAYTFVAGAHPTVSDTITISINGVKASTYIVRVQIDGAESIVDANNNPQLVLP